MTLNFLFFEAEDTLVWYSIAGLETVSILEKAVLLYQMEQ